ncbi:thiol peroxidase [Parasphaerochaeta coccoides]|uniref:Thiol peroxidase n=1 Tax=Parasphaerochaeta coccoides (strain ATCC BAA-1237 / DSM 17374 / SPN1) TaxID=760011 RepID=F4GJM5_PARC1|nr:thiol peroxidase [Parasphaerochaeta coccoides]AEC02772.1 thiol peroxidase (atypical 2-Cys peroxiredoxin) [Parasphaerochaeta coccoides DSM 17374]
MKVVFKGQPITLKGTHLKVGDKAPSFTAVANNLDTFESRSVTGKKLFVSVPSIDTSVCDMEVRRFNQEAASLKDTTVITISMDLPFAQARWCGAAGIDKVMTVSDYRDREFAEKYGVELSGYGLLARAIFAVDENDIVTYVEYVADVSTHPDYEKALAAVR